MKNLFARFAKDESGATAIEYGLIAALIAVVCIGAFGPGVLPTGDRVARPKKTWRLESPNNRFVRRRGTDPS
jgi:Flp pilus assembly pilin Flp